MVNLPWRTYPGGLTLVVDLPWRWTNPWWTYPCLWTYPEWLLHLNLLVSWYMWTYPWWWTDPWWTYPEWVLGPLIYVDLPMVLDRPMVDLPHGGLTLNGSCISISLVSLTPGMCGPTLVDLPMVVD